MLVLSRRKDQAIVIGDGVTVTVLDVDRNGVVKLGIDAPRSVRILRQELVAEATEANRTALVAPTTAAMVEQLNLLMAGGSTEEPPPAEAADDDGDGR